MANGYAKYSGIGGSGGGGGGVSSLNAETGDVVLVAGSGISVTPSGQNITIAATGGGSGTVTSVSVVSANGLAGSVATATTTPAITLSTSITGVLKGNGTAISAATAGTDYVIPSGSITGTAANITASSNSTLTTLSSLSLPYSQVTGGPSTNAITALTGDITAAGPGSVAATLATVNGNVGSFGSSSSIPNFTVNAKGIITAAGGNVVIAPAGTLSGTTLNATVVTSSLTSIGVQAQALNMNSNLINNVTDPASPQDAATKNYVDTVASGLNPIQAVTAATTGSNIVGTYVNGAAGVGATFTTTSTSTFTVDGVTPTLTQRILIKDQSSGFQNGVYNVTQLATGIIPTIFTRSLDYDTAGDMNAGDLIPVISGTVNGNTSWLQTATITTVGTDSLVFTQWTANPANYLLKANNLSDVSSKSTSFNNLSPMTTGGDIIYGGASGTGTRLANGSSGQVLTSSGGTSAPSWQSASGSPTTMFVNLSATGYTNTSNAPIIYDTVVYDTSSGYSLVTGKYTVPTTGYYQISITGLTSSGATTASVYKNNSQLFIITDFTSSDYISGAMIVSCSSGDTLSINTNNAKTFIGSATGGTSWGLHLIK